MVKTQLQMLKNWENKLLSKREKMVYEDDYAISHMNAPKAVSHYKMLSGNNKKILKIMTDYLDGRKAAIESTSNNYPVLKREIPYNLLIIKQAYGVEPPDFVEWSLFDWTDNSMAPIICLMEHTKIETKKTFLEWMCNEIRPYRKRKSEDTDSDDYS